MKGGPGRNREGKREQGMASSAELETEYVPLLETEGMVCYGAKQQYTENQKYWKQTVFNLCCMIIAATPLLLLVVLWKCVRCFSGNSTQKTA